MKYHASLEIIELSREANRLLTQAQESLASAPFPALNALVDTLPASVEQAGAPKVVVAGQYSAGKSTLLKALTGIDSIEIGEAITTDRPHSYQWEGVELVDTPGIETSLRPDHDALSYREIAAADLILYVISNELMDEHIADNFRKLTIEQEKAHKIMLVVNKMDRHAQSNIPQAREVIRGALDALLAPYSTDDIPVAFISADLAISAQSEEDAELAEFDWEDSNFEGFHAQLDRFISQRKLAGQYTSGLHQLQHALMKARAELSRENPAVAGVEEMLLQKRKRLIDGKQRIEQRASTKVREAASDIRNTGTRTASQFTMDGKADEIKATLKNAEISVEHRSDRLTADLQSTLAEALAELQGDLATLADSEFSKSVIARALRELDENIGLDTLNPEMLQRIANVGDKLGSMGLWLTAQTTSKGDNIPDLLAPRAPSEGQIHSTVKYIGKKLGHKFKPWEAVKWSKRIGTAGKVLVVAGPLVSMGAQAFSDYQAAQQEVELKRLRNSVRSGFNDAADELEMYFDAQTGTFVTETVLAEIEEVDLQIEALRGGRQSEHELMGEVEDLLEQTRGLIREIHAAN